MNELPSPSFLPPSQARATAQIENSAGADERLRGGENISGNDSTADIHYDPDSATSYLPPEFHIRSQGRPDLTEGGPHLTPASQSHPGTPNNAVESSMPRVSFPLLGNDTSFTSATIPGPSSLAQSLPSTPSNLHAMPHHIEPLQVILSDDKLVCRGVGSSMEDALLSGHVVLNLAESTCIKEISLQLIGKVKLLLGESTSSVHTIYTHSWMLMEHKHTVKEGRHVFSFQHLVPASLPASMNISYAGAEVYYKLRATAVRSSFHSNWTAVRPVFLMRMFDREAVEFSQVLEVENTWPEKIMYSILVPHKAFAAGDTIPSLVKFQPVSKGVFIKSISIEVKEAVFSRWKNYPEFRTSRVVASVQYEIKDGKAVKVMEGGVAVGVGASGSAHDEQGSSSVSSSRGVGASAMRASNPPSDTQSQPHLGLSSLGQAGTGSSISPLSRNPQGSRSMGYIPALNPTVQDPSSTSSVYAGRRRGRGGRTFNADTMFGGASGNNEASPSPIGTPNQSPRGSGEHVPFQHQPAPSAPDTQPTLSPTDEERIPMVGDSELETKLYLYLPISSSPSQSFPPSNSTNTPTPIAVSHKINFRVLISNLDGHISELRCALPLHVLDARLLKEARAATRLTRNVLLGHREEDEGDLVGEEEEEEVELPSYNEHILDRVANASLEPRIGRNGRRRVGNIAMNTLCSLPSSLANSPTLPEWHGTSVGGYFGLHSGLTTPLHSMPGSPARSRRPSLEGEEGSGQDPLFEFDQELMLSLGEVASASNIGGGRGRRSNFASPSTSRMGSRANSRATSPESSNAHNSHSRHSDSSASSTSGSSSRGLFHLKPFSSIARFGGNHSKKDKDGDKNHPSRGHLPPPSSSRNCSTIRTTDGERASQQHDINPLSRVPSYGISSRGFLGGGPPPLTFYRDLPSYDQSESANSGANRDLSGPSGARGSVLERSRSEASLLHSGNLMNQLRPPQTP